jgi:cytochrome c peroxidase
MHVGRKSLAALTVGLLALAGGSLAAPTAKDAPDKSAAKAPSARKLHLPAMPYHYTVELPAHFTSRAAQRFDNTPADNPVTDAGATLGRVLFYDTRLSANGTTACGTCHLQKHAFTVPDRFPKGFEGKLVDRNSMALVNIRYYARGRFFWDERAPSLEEQALMPIQSKIEMGQDLATVTSLLSRDETYPELFRQAFGDSTVTPKRVGAALAQFLRSLVSSQSKYDEGMAKVLSSRDDFENFTAQENEGKRLFLNVCATCHKPRGQDAHFIMVRPLNNGLDADAKGDGGVGDITLQGRQVGLFKSPSLRNVEYTAPYMHDGRLATLEAVIDHYSKEVKPHPNVDGRVRRRRNFSDAQKAALVAFLKTLSDPKFIADPKFSDPFQ